ncbi:chaperonin 10-like protein [Lipomyces doorenjongii]|uniref:chaperonin 10-like protein n=1 Tax=Lipomyces doorenjongii TaxID=383834 RepID=UPI0034CD9A85
MSKIQPINRAAYQPAVKANSLEVKSATYTPAPDNGIVIRNHAIAINPIDWLIQAKGDIMYKHLIYPCILGLDVAGEVIEVGKSVTRFQKGDRVLGYCRGIDAKVNSSAEGAFQEYTVVMEDFTSHIPSSVSYESASVIPLGLSTASAALFQEDQLALRYPTVPPVPTGQTLLIWGGSTSVGCNAIQLGVAAGYEVFATSSAKNSDLLKNLGASQVFDYKSKTIVRDLTTALKGKTTAGGVAIGDGGAEVLMSVLQASEGQKQIALVSYPVPKTQMNRFVFLRTALTFVSWTIAFKIKGAFNGVKGKYVNASSVTHNGVGRAVYVDFLPKALETGAFVPAPEPIVAGKGLESIQTAFNLQKKGVSAKKIVVTL